MKNLSHLIKTIGLLMALLPVVCFGQTKNVNHDTVNHDVLTRLKAYTSTHLTEKVYLQFDKPYYAVGDTMYFKAYVTMGEHHQLSQLSGVVHVDLVDEQNNLANSIKLKLNNGVAWGDFALLDTLDKGNYQVRAYTAWMENDPGSFFSQFIQVGSTQTTNVPESGTPRAKPNKIIDIQFMPEGGNLVNGIKSKVAFKAVGKNGLAIDVKGVVVDNDNNKVAEFASSHLGMGSFYLAPQPGKSYKIKTSYGDGYSNVTELPRAAEQGIALEVNNDSLSIASVKIKSSDGYLQANRNKPYKLLIYSAGKATLVNFNLDSAVTNMDIVKRKLFTGVTRLTLFSGDNEPLSERLIFIQNHDELNFELQTDKPQYNKRDKVMINLGVKTRADEASMGHFSISVIDETKVQQDEDDAHTILSDLLLTSDLKGYIEKPNYYFNNINDSKLKELDLVMLTHGYRKFEWKKLVNNAYGKPWSQPETSLQVNGHATMLGGRRIKNGTVALLSLKNGILATQKIDDKGNFIFNKLPAEDTGKLILQAQNFRNNNITTITYLGDYPITPTKINPEKEVAAAQDITAFIDNEKIQQNVPLHGKTLKEVKIKAFKPDNDYETVSLAGAGNADQVMHADQISEVSGMLVYSLWGRLHGITFIVSNGHFFPRLISASSPMMVIYDGVEGSDMSTITSEEIATVEVLTSASAAIYGMRGGNGVLVITSKHMDPKYIKAVGILPITLNGFYKAREFYAPRYDASYTENGRRDLRSTIYWKPELATDKDGKAAFDYFNADGSGSYKVIVEGIDSNGNLGRKTFSYKVE
ncbi:MAG: hypothetical protein ACHQHN_11010 [Sphingobacteriales bacterium]